jgi:hypothetical protein
VLAFADPDLIRLARESFIPVAGDDWYQRRRNDDEGTFFRKVADQGPRKGAGGSTRQGIYCLTASGKLLAYRNHQDPRVMLQVLRDALVRWQKLPAAERKPGGVKVADPAKVDPRYARTPPEGGLILNVFTRILNREKGQCVRGQCSTPGGEGAARDHLWLTRQEWQGLIPAEPRKGQRFAMPAGIAQRILRFHLLDNTRGEPPSWNSQEVRKHALNWTVTEVTPGEVRLALEGSALLATHSDPDRAQRGFDVALRGELRYDRKARAITRFDLLAVGDHWGEGTFTRKARPGRKPLGVAFELSKGKDPADRVPPQAAREIAAYLGRSR